MSSERSYDVIQPEGGVPIKAWTRGVPIEEAAARQLANVARLPFIHRWVAAMPDIHWGIGATVGSVIPTVGAIIPAAVGVDIGCGMMAVETTLTANDLPQSLREVRAAIEAAVPHGRTPRGRDKGSWGTPPPAAVLAWAGLKPGFDAIVTRHPAVGHSNHQTHLGTLGTGNHFIEVCLDEGDRVWLLLHSGSRGVGNRIGSYFIELAKKDMRKWMVNLPDADLAYLPEGTDHFHEYVEAVEWAQAFALTNRRLMMDAIIAAVGSAPGIPPFTAGAEAVNCHHNYVAREYHYGKNVLLTRKGAVRAREGDLGIIPGSMGARSYIVRGKGNPESFHSCSHGAGRAMSRAEAKRRFTVADHAQATAGIECRKDPDVIDETPGAYKSIDAVMEAQKDLVEIVHTLRQVVCVKG
ncbi:MAG: RNA-splicing ligase RtcB [Candidatus Rokuibacteriota bacterium]|nr:MAG: RNA-splicing ligase RtcB [Candidatus Rokubacteria bacterium]